MFDCFFIVGKQVLIILAMVLVGYLCGKKRVLNDTSIQGINNFVMLFVMPCMAVSGFQLDFSSELLRDLLIGIVVATLMHFFNFYLSQFIFRKKETNDRNMLCVSATLTNGGFVGYPMQTALIGSAGIFYGIPYTTLMSFFAWTIGAAAMSGDKKEMQIKKVLTSPAILGIFIGLFMFFFSIPLPPVIDTAIANIAAMNVSLPMIIIGYYMSKVDLIAALRKRKIWEASFVRLILLPLLGLGLLILCGVRGNILIASTVANATPPAAIVTMLAAKYNRGMEEASELVSLETVFSVITMPLMIMLAGYLAG